MAKNSGENLEITEPTIVEMSEDKEECNDTEGSNSLPLGKKNS